MCGTACVSFLTNKASDEALFRRYAPQIGGWVYGCDVCQDVCPINKGKLSGEKEFPGIEELGSAISLEKIVMMDYAYLRDVIASKFWYIEAKDVWKWKRNALNAMLNTRHERHEAMLVVACDDKDVRIRMLAEKTLEKIKNEAGSATV
jgi:epoxyqueuosine reductase